MGKKKDKPEPIDHTYDLPTAQAKLLDYLHHPLDDIEKRTFSSISPGMIYPMSALQQINNYRKQLFQGKVQIYLKEENRFIDETEWNETVKKYLVKGIDLRKGKKQLSFILDHNLVDTNTKHFMEEILVLSPSAKDRAGSLIIMEKDKKQNKSSSGFGMFSGILNRGEESDEEDYEEEDDDEEPEVEVNKQKKV